MPPQIGDLDSRLRSGRIRLRSFFGHVSQQIFCLSCGRSGGWVTQGLPPGVVYLCPQCEETKGRLPTELVGFQPR